MPGPSEIDWPVNLAAERIAEAFRKRVMDATEGVGLSLLGQFVEAVQDPYFGGILDHWLAFRKAEGQDGAERAQTLAAKIRKKEQDPELAQETHELFKALLGVAILRPILPSSSDRLSSMYYASIHHRLLDGPTKTSILDSVVIPAGKGTAGDALRGEAVHSPVSFGERRGVVEWQDLVLGQVSMLVVAYPYEEAQEQSCSCFVVSAFFPLPGIFDTSKCQCGFSHILNDSVESVGRDLVCGLCDAQLSFKESRHTRKVSKESHSVAEGKGSTALLVGNVAQMLVPSSFVELPTPVLAVGVALPLPENPSQFTLDRLVLDDSAVKVVLRLWMEPMLKALVQPSADASEPSHSVAEQRRKRGEHWARLKDKYEIQPSQTFLFQTNDNRTIAAWVIHTTNKDGWPETAKACFDSITQVLILLRQMVEALTPNNPRLQEARNALLSAGVRNAWRHLYAVYKLRQNVLASFFSLLSRVICSSDSDKPENLANQLEYILSVVLDAPWARQERPTDLAKRVKDDVQTIRNEVKNSFGASFLATSSYVLSPGHVRLSKLEGVLQPHQRLFSDLIQIASLCGCEITDYSEGDSAQESCLDAGDSKIFRANKWSSVDIPLNGRAASLVVTGPREESLQLNYSVESEPYCNVDLAAHANFADDLSQELASGIPSGLTPWQICHFLAPTGIRFRPERTESPGPRLLVAHRPYEELNEYEESRITPVATAVRDSVRAAEAALQMRRRQEVESDNVHLEHVKEVAEELSKMITRDVVRQANRLVVALEKGRLFDNDLLARLFPQKPYLAWPPLQVEAYHDPRDKKQNRALLSFAIHQMFGETPAAESADELLSHAKTILSKATVDQASLGRLLHRVLEGDEIGFNTFKRLCRPVFIKGYEAPFYSLAVRLFVNPGTAKDFSVIIATRNGENREMNTTNFDEFVEALHEEPSFDQLSIGLHADWMKPFVDLIAELQPNRGKAWVSKVTVSDQLKKTIHCEVQGLVEPVRAIFNNRGGDERGYRGACRDFHSAIEKLGIQVQWESSQLIVSFS
jgi:hypothetical protein